LFKVENAGLGDIEIKNGYQELTTQFQLHYVGDVLIYRVMWSNECEFPAENDKIFQEFVKASL